MSVYVSEDYGEIYVPVANYRFNQARSEAAAMAAELIEVWGRSRYVGKSNVPLHDHGDWEGCEECPSVPVWRFEVYEGTARW